MLADQLIHLRPDDVLLLMSYGVPYPEIRVVLAEAKRCGARTILITDAEGGENASVVDLVIPVRRGRPGRMALHGATLVCLEALTLSMSALTPSASLTSLDQLDRLRTELRTSLEAG